MTTKEFITPDAFLKDAFSLARRIFDSGYRPDLMLVIWRGGAPVGLAVHEFFRYKGIDVNQFVLTVKSYTGIDQRTEPCIENIDGALSVMAEDAEVLIIDDIYDTGSTIRTVMAKIASRTLKVRVATLYVKKGTAVFPEYYMKESARWIVFPHEIVDLTPDEIRRKDEQLHGILTADVSRK